MKQIIFGVLLATSCEAMAGANLLDCRISRVADRQAFGRSVALGGPASEVMVYIENGHLKARVGNYSEYSAEVAKEILTHHDLSDKDLVYLAKHGSQEMVILAVLKTRAADGLRPGRVVLQRGPRQKVVAYLKCQ